MPADCVRVRLRMMSPVALGADRYNDDARFPRVPVAGDVIASPDGATAIVTAVQFDFDDGWDAAPLTYVVAR